MALSSHLLLGKELIIAARILFFIALYSIDIVSDRQQHIQHIACTMRLHIRYIALWTAVIHLQSLITRRPQVQVLSPQPRLIADFVRNQRFFVEVWMDTDRRSVPNCTPTGCKIGGNGFCGDCRICADILYLI